MYVTVSVLERRGFCHGKCSYAQRSIHWVNRQERLQPRNEIAREVYLGPRARTWAKARAIAFSRAIVFRGWSRSCLLIPYISWCNDDISVHYYAPRLPLCCYHCGSYAELQSISDEMKKKF